MTGDDAGATNGSDLIRINVCQAQLLYMRLFVNYNRNHIGDYFTKYTSMGLENRLSSGSQKDLWDKICYPTGYLVAPQQRAPFFQLDLELLIRLEHSSISVKQPFLGQSVPTLYVLKIDRHTLTLTI